MGVITTVLTSGILIVQDKDFLKKIGCVVLPFKVKDVTKTISNKYQTFGDYVVVIHDHYPINKIGVIDDYTDIFWVKDSMLEIEKRTFMSSDHKLWKAIMYGDFDKKFDFKLKVELTNDKNTKSKEREIRNGFYKEMNKLVEAYEFMEKKELSNRISRCTNGSPKGQSIYDQFFKRK